MKKKRHTARRRHRTRNTHRRRTGYYARKSNPAPRRRARRHNARRGYFARRRRARYGNPSRGGRIVGLVTKATYTIGGAIGTRALTQAVLGSGNQGMMGYAANAVAAFLLGFAGGKLFGKDAGQFITIGGFVGIVMRAISEFTQIGKVVSLNLSGMGDYAFAGVSRGLGHFEPMDYFVPLASSDARGTISGGATPPAMIARVAQSVMPAPAAAGMTGLGRGKSRYGGARYWGAN